MQFRRGVYLIFIHNHSHIYLYSHYVECSEALFGDSCWDLSVIWISSLVTATMSALQQMSAILLIEKKLQWSPDSVSHSGHGFPMLPDPTKRLHPSTYMATLSSLPPYQVSPCRCDVEVSFRHYEPLHSTESSDPLPGSQPPIPTGCLGVGCWRGSQQYTGYPFLPGQSTNTPHLPPSR